MAIDHNTAELQAYWKANLGIIGLHLAVWFTVSYLLGIVFANPLDAYRFGGFPVGFWFANQGSLVVFVIQIWVYVWQMDRLDIAHGVDET